MSVLVDWQIRDRRTLPVGDPRHLVLDPFSDYGECPSECISFGLSTSGYDLRAGYNFLLFQDTAAVVVDPKSFDCSRFQVIRREQGKTVLIPPRSFILAETIEYIEMPRDVMGEIRGKSRMARAGYVMASTPIEAGWKGKITLEIANLSALPLAVYAGEGIGQLVFHRLDAPPERDYGEKPNARFQNQPGLVGPQGCRS